MVISHKFVLVSRREGRPSCMGVFGDVLLFDMWSGLQILLDYFLDSAFVGVIIQDLCSQTLFGLYTQQDSSVFSKIFFDLEFLYKLISCDQTFSVVISCFNASPSFCHPLFSLIVRNGHFVSQFQLYQNLQYVLFQGLAVLVGFEK